MVKNQFEGQAQILLKRKNKINKTKNKKSMKTSAIEQVKVFKIRTQPHTAKECTCYGYFQ